MTAEAAQKAYISKQDFRVNKFTKPTVAWAKINDESVTTARAIIANPVYEALRDKW